MTRPSRTTAPPAGSESRVGWAIQKKTTARIQAAPRRVFRRPGFSAPLRAGWAPAGWVPVPVAERRSAGCRLAGCRSAGCGLAGRRLAGCRFFRVAERRRLRAFELHFYRRPDDPRVGAHEDHQSSLVVGEVDLGLGAAGEEVVVGEDRLHHDGVERSRGDLHAVLAEHLQNDRVAVVLVEPAEGVGLADLERKRAREVDERDVVERKGRGQSEGRVVVDAVDEALLGVEVVLAVALPARSVLILDEAPRDQRFRVKPAIELLIHAEAQGARLDAPLDRIRGKAVERIDLAHRHLRLTSAENAGPQGEPHFFAGRKGNAAHLVALDPQRVQDQGRLLGRARYRARQRECRRNDHRRARDDPAQAQDLPDRGEDPYPCGSAPHVVPLLQRHRRHAAGMGCQRIHQFGVRGPPVGVDQGAVPGLAQRLPHHDGAVRPKALQRIARRGRPEPATQDKPGESTRQANGEGWRHRLGNGFAEHDVGTALKGLDEGRQVIGVLGEVSLHGHDRIPFRVAGVSGRRAQQLLDGATVPDRLLPGDHGERQHPPVLLQQGARAVA